MPPATASPAEAAVCTKLFSRMVAFLKKRKIPMEIIAAGIEAEVRMPSLNAKYEFDIASKVVNKIAKTMLLGLNSTILFYLSKTNCTKRRLGLDPTNRALHK